MPLNKLLKSTHLRFAIALTAVFAVIYLLVGWFAFLAVDAELRERVSQADLVTSTGFVELYRSSGRSALVEAVRSSSESGEPDDSFAWLGTRNGERLAGPALTAPRSLQTGDVAGQSLLPELDEGYHIQVTDLDDMRLITGVSHEESDEILGLVSLVFGAAALLTLLLASLAGLALARQGQRRIDAASGVLDRVASGEMTRRLPVSGSGDDIDQLSTRINSALDQLHATVEGIRQVSADIAHDLRTPINRLGIHLERLSDSVGVDQVLGPQLELARAEVRQIITTFDALLRIAQIEAGARRARFQPLDLSEIAESVFDVYAAVAEENDQTLSLKSEGDTPARILGDRDLLVQLIANLIENAIRHSGAGAMIRVLTRAEPDHVVLRVSDTGPGIPVDDHARVLKRFHRLDQSRHTPGSGLGLALVKAVSDLHNAKLTLKNAVPGLWVELRFARLCPEITAADVNSGGN
ncbi:HAMP domain-containing sensor histidine kinase [uncultured Maricaulis sp.]|uniref:sensor histidine kinase n=1 Tax=uncultured Maricaulis sp. TaxID=174710 RepID=UPI0030DAB491